MRSAAKLSNQQVQYIKRRYDEKSATMPSLAREYRVSATTIWRIVHGVRQPEDDEEQRERFVTPVGTVVRERLSKPLKFGKRNVYYNDYGGRGYGTPVTRTRYSIQVRF